MAIAVGLDEFHGDPRGENRPVASDYDYYKGTAVPANLRECKTLAEFAEHGGRLKLPTHEAITNAFQVPSSPPASDVDEEC